MAYTYTFNSPSWLCPRPSLVNAPPSSRLETRAPPTSTASHPTPRGACGAACGKAGSAREANSNSTHATPKAAGQHFRISCNIFARSVQFRFRFANSFATHSQARHQFFMKVPFLYLPLPLLLRCCLSRPGRLSRSSSSGTRGAGHGVASEQWSLQLTACSSLPSQQSHTPSPTRDWKIWCACYRSRRCQVTGHRLQGPRK